MEGGTFFFKARPKLYPVVSEFSFGLRGGGEEEFTGSKFKVATPWTTKVNCFPTTNQGSVVRSTSCVWNVLYSYICVCEAIYLCPLCDLATSRAAANMAKDQPLDKLRHHVSFVLHVSDLLLQLIDLYTRRTFVEFIRCYSPTSPTTPTLKVLTNELKSVSDWYTLGVNLNFKTY